MLRFTAEDQVRQAFMQTPQAKTLVAHTMKQLKADHAAIKKTLSTGVKSAGGKKRPPTRRRGPVRIRFDTHPRASSAI